MFTSTTMEDLLNAFYSVLWCLPLVYFIVGHLFHTYPNLLHKKKELGHIKKCQLIAHRGSRLEGLPENSIAAFKDALKHADILELDVWLTKDNEIIIHHDDTYKRMTNGNVTKAMNELYYDETPDLHHEIPHQNHRLHEYSNHESLKIPTFERLLQLIQHSDTHLIIEFKQDSELLISRVHELLIKYNRIKVIKHTNIDMKYSKDYWFSLVERINQKLYRYDPCIPRITSVTGMLKIYMYYFCGILPYMTISESAFGCTLEVITLRKIQHEAGLKHLPGILHRILAYVAQGSPPSFFMQPGLFEHLRLRGMPILFLGVNNVRQVRISIEMGATAILTDKVSFISDYMKNHPDVHFTTID